MSEKKVTTTTFNSDKVTVTKKPVFVPEETTKTTYTTTLTVNQTPKSGARPTSIYNLLKKTPGPEPYTPSKPTDATPGAKQGDSFNSSGSSFEEEQEEEEEDYVEDEMESQDSTI